MIVVHKPYVYKTLFLIALPYPIIFRAERLLQPPPQVAMLMKGFFVLKSWEKKTALPPLCNQNLVELVQNVERIISFGCLTELNMFILSG